MLNKEKYILGTKSLTFLGHILSSEGVYPDPEEIDSIVNMQSPNSVVELQIIKFVPNLAQITAPVHSGDATIKCN